MLQKSVFYCILSHLNSCFYIYVKVCRSKTIPLNFCVLKSLKYLSLFFKCLQILLFIHNFFHSTEKKNWNKYTYFALVSCNCKNMTANNCLLRGDECYSSVSLSTQRMNEWADWLTGELPKEKKIRYCNKSPVKIL